jgi:hypothetical protein
MHADALLKMLEDSESVVRRAAVVTLGKLPPAVAAQLLPPNSCFVSDFCTVRLLDTALLQGRVYYEVTLLEAGGAPQIGWATPGCRPGNGNGVGDDSVSWGADGVRGKLWHEGSKGWGVVIWRGRMVM